MERERFESALDRLLNVHRRKICAAIDASACQTAYDREKAREADDSYEAARDRFLEEVFAPASQAAPIVSGHESKGRSRTRGRPSVWRRWVEVAVPCEAVVYTFTASAGSLALDAGAVESGDDTEIRGLHFDPLDTGHLIRFRGQDYMASTRAPEAVQRSAIEACREVALRLLSAGVRRDQVAESWPPGWPSFASIVTGRPAA